MRGREEVVYKENLEWIRSRGGSRGVRRVLEHLSNIHTFTAKNDNCSEAVLKIIKLLLLIMTTALKLSWNRASHVTDRKYTSSPDNREAFSVFFFQFRCHLLSFSSWTTLNYLMACTPELISYWLAPLKVISYWPAPLKFEFSGCSRRILLPSKRFLIGQLLLLHER